MPVFLPIATVVSVAVSGVLWLIFGLPGLVHASRTALELCRDILALCGGYMDSARLLIIWGAVGAAVSGVVFGASRAIKNAIICELAVRRLPVRKGKGRVALILDDNIKTAFTHGLLRPRVYVSKGLINGLERKELNAVMLHEAHHRKSLDPLRFLLYSTLADMFFYLPIVKDLLNGLKTVKEAEADRAACRDAEERLLLAGAIVKAATFNAAGRVGLVSAASITGTSSVATRVSSLIAGKKVRLGRPTGKSIGLSLAAGMIILVSIIMPLAPAFGAKAQRCTTDHCEAHMERLGAACKTHCALSEGSPQHNTAHRH